MPKSETKTSSLIPHPPQPLTYSVILYHKYFQNPSTLFHPHCHDTSPRIIISRMDCCNSLLSSLSSSSMVSFSSKLCPATRSIFRNFYLMMSLSSLKTITHSLLDYKITSERLHMAQRVICDMTSAYFSGLVSRDRLFLPSLAAPLTPCSSLEVPSSLSVKFVVHAVPSARNTLQFLFTWLIPTHSSGPC